MKKLIVFFLCILLLSSICIPSIAEEWVCGSCGNSATGNFCNVCGAAKPTDGWICPQCGNNATGNFCNNCGSPKPAEGEKASFTVDYNSEVEFEAALNKGEITTGKIVRFKVDEVHPQSLRGFNLWAGEHLNFISERPVDIKAGDIVTARITDVISSMGSWFLSYEILNKETPGGSVDVDTPTETPILEQTNEPEVEVQAEQTSAEEKATEPEATPIVSSDALALLEEAKNHNQIAILPSQDKYTYYIQDYIGLNLASIGYTSMGGERFDRYGNGLLEIIPVALDGSYVNIEDEDILSQYVVVAQSISPNTEMKLAFKKNSSGKEYSNLIDYQSIESIDLLVVKLDGSMMGDAIPFSPVAIKPAPDRYTCYVYNYVGKNLATVGYTSLGGDRLDEYLNARIELCVVTADGTHVDISDSSQLQQYVVIGQNIAPNTEIKLVYQKDSNGNEYDNLIDSCSVGLIDLQVRRVDGIMYNDPAPYEPVAINTSPDKYTWYIRNYVGKNLASVGYTSLGGKRMDKYGDAALELVLLTPDRSVVDISDEEAMSGYIVTEQDIAPNSKLTVTYRKDSKGKEYSNLIDSMSYKKITLTLQKINTIPEEPAPTPDAKAFPATTAAPAQSSFSGPTQKDGDFTYVVQDDDTAIIVGYTGKGSSVSISSSIGGHEVSGIGPSAFENHTEITNIIMWADPKFIGERAFMGCTKLKEISISSDCTSIGASAFEGCVKLNSVLLWGDPEIGPRAFYGCTSIKEISIGSDTKLIGESAFEGCTSLSSVLIWGGTNIDKRAFYGCTSIKELSIDSDTDYIGDYAFYGCTSLKEVIIWGSNTKIGTEAFGNCPKLKGITQW